MVNDEPHYTGKITTMKKSLLLITAVLALLSASCDSPSNTLSEDVSAESHEESEVSLPELKQKQYELTDSPYALPEFKEYIAPEYDLGEYSPFGTEGATKIIVRTEDIGGTELNDTMLKSIPNVGDIDKLKNII